MPGNLHRWLLALASLLAVTGFSKASKPDALVLGGTGRLGAEVVRSLSAAGYAVTVFTRATSDRSRLADQTVDYVIGDLLDGPSVTAALKGRAFSYVVDASARGPNKDPFYGDVMHNVLAALDAAQVRQFILHGSVGAGNSADVIDKQYYAQMRKMLAAKTEAEERLKDSGMAYTIIRNGVIKLDGTAATDTAQLTEDVSIMGTVTRPDLATLTLHCIDNAACINKVLHVYDKSWMENPGY